jgi:hypothetical protein
VANLSREQAVNHSFLESVMKRVLPIVVLVSACACAPAAILTNVPMQGGMVMPALSYNAAEGVLHVEVDPTIPQLVPLLASNPGDSFNPADPWYEALDPSQQGLASSRRYGFVMAAVTDLLPDGTSIAIRKLMGMDIHSPWLRLCLYTGLGFWGV